MTGESTVQAKRWERWQSHNAALERRRAVTGRIIGTVVVSAALVWVFAEIMMSRFVL